MIVEERQPLPESVAGLVSVAMRGYARRFPLYFGVAVAGLALEAALAFTLRTDIGVLYAGSIVVDALVATIVTLGIIADLRVAEPPTNETILRSSVPRWGQVAIVGLITAVVTFATNGAVFGPPDASTAYGFLVPLIVIGWGSLSFASVIAATDDKVRPELLPLLSIGRSIQLALARQNFGRLILLSLIAIVPDVVETILSDQLKVRKISAWLFLGNIPVDALISGPLQAVITLFYLDFIRRCTPSPRES